MVLPFTVQGVYDYGTFSFESKAQVLEQAKKYWNPDKTQFWTDAGVDLVIDRRDGYFLWDMGGRRLIDMHLNGGTYNLGHRNPEVMAGAHRRHGALRHRQPPLPLGGPHGAGAATGRLGAGVDHQGGLRIRRRRGHRHRAQERHGTPPSGARSSRSSRRTTATPAWPSPPATTASPSCSSPTGPTSSSRCPFGDVDAMERALSGGDVAAVIMETIPATYGFPLPPTGYLEAVKELTERYDALYIADEVQTGLMRTGEMWGITKHGIEPDIMVAGKGLSGGMYPITAAMLSDRAAQWLDEDGFAHISTFGGAELGCVAAIKTLEITSRPEVRSNVHAITDVFAAGLARIQADHPDWFVGIRQNGVVIGLEFDHPEGAKFVMRELYENGVWAIFSTLDPRVLQFKPGLLLSRELCDDVLDRLDVAVGQAAKAAMG